MPSLTTSSHTQNTLISSVSATAYDTLAPKHVLNNRIRAQMGIDFGILENGIIKIPIQSDIAVTEFKTNKSEVVSTGAGVCWYVCRHKIRGLALPSSHDDG